MEDRAAYSRVYHRLRVAYPVIFGGAPFVGEGTVSDLSFTGCQVATEGPVLVGSYVKLSVLMPNPRQSLFIKLGKIRWAQNGSFGVEFIRLPTIDRHRLDRILWEQMRALLEARTTCASQNP